MYQGTLSGSRVCIKRIRVYQDTQKDLKVRYWLSLPLFAMTNEIADLLPRGRSVETLDTPKHRTTPGFHSRSLPAYLRMDVWRGPTKLYQQEPRGKPTWTRRHLLLCLFLRLLRYQLSGIAKGLCYLHSCNVLHGNLKGVRDRSNSSFTAILMPGQSNILVDAAGHAHITDYGFARSLVSWLRTQLCRRGSGSSHRAMDCARGLKRWELWQGS
jgi:serine/threonine protein kinase